MRKSKITAAIITKNEEKNIKGCIDSIKGWVDEIVVVDGVSQDRTQEIARQLGAKVVEHKFEGTFAKERNIGMENASGDWVLHLDADDRVTQAFKDKADAIIDTDPAVNVYKFYRKNFFLGHSMDHGGWYHQIPNLVRKAQVKFDGVLHERPVFEGRLGEINADIEHHPFHSLSQFVIRQNRYSDLESDRIFKEKGLSELPGIRKNVVGRSFKIFWKIYIKKKGHKEGMYGLVFAVLFALTNFLIWSKYWELCVKKDTAR